MFGLGRSIYLVQGGDIEIHYVVNRPWMNRTVSKLNLQLLKTVVVDIPQVAGVEALCVPTWRVLSSLPRRLVTLFQIEDLSG